MKAISLWSFYKPVCTKPVTCRQNQNTSFSCAWSGNMVFNLVQKLFHYNNCFQIYACLNIIDIENANARNPCSKMWMKNEAFSLVTNVSYYLISIKFHLICHFSCVLLLKDTKIWYVKYLHFYIAKKDLFKIIIFFENPWKITGQLFMDQMCLHLSLLLHAIFCILQWILQM